MKYKGYTITRQLLPGADFKVVNGIVRPRKPRRCDVDFYTVEGDGVRFNESSVADAKSTIDRRIAIERAQSCTGLGH